MSRYVKKILSQIEIVAFLSFSEISGVHQTEYGCESQSYNMKNKKSQPRLQQTIVLKTAFHYAIFLWSLLYLPTPQQKPQKYVK